MAQSNFEIFKSIIERGFSRGDLSVADEVCAERLLEHEYLANSDLPGPEILKSQIEDARRSIKGLKLTLEAWVETEDTVWARSRATGTDTRSGKAVAIDVIDICRFSNGKLVEHWACRIASRCCIKLARFLRHRDKLCRLITAKGHLRQNPCGPHMSPVPPRATELCPLMGRQRWCRTRIDRSRFTERGNPVNPANKQHALFIDFRIAKCIGARVAGVLGPDTV